MRDTPICTRAIQLSKPYHGGRPSAPRGPSPRRHAIRYNVGSARMSELERTAQSTAKPPAADGPPPAEPLAPEGPASPELAGTPDPGAETGTAPVVEPAGSAAYAAWRAAKSRPPDVALTVTEYALYTDADVIGEPPPFGPYRLLHTSAEYAVARGVPVLYLRVTRDQAIQPIDWETRGADHYHGGTEGDEIAALLSLEAGMRAAVEDVPARLFLVPGDPYGRPHAFAPFRRLPQLVDPGPRPRVPAATGKRHIDDLPRLSRLLDLTPADAIAVVKAARLYQQALWLAETAPELAWLLLVSAVEAAAVCRADEPSDAEHLAAWSPALAERLAATPDEALLAEVTRLVKPVTGATGKVVKFLLQYAPQELPSPRPHPDYQVDLGSRTKRARLFSLIYGYRSGALHAGRPFPSPMCEAPRREDGVPAERPLREGLRASGLGGAVWSAAEVPILLNTWAVIVRSALLAWWDALLPPAREA